VRAARLLIVGSGEQAYREYLFDRIGRRYEIVLLCHGPMTWQGPFVIDGLGVDLADLEAARAAARALARRHPLGGVLTWVEGNLAVAHAIATDLGFPSPPATAAPSRDKGGQRRAFAANGVPSARSIAVETSDEAARAAEEIGYPVVVKPRHLGGSLDVRRAEDRHGVEAAYAAAASANYPEFGAGGGVLVEEYLDGPEISVDSWVFDGQARPTVLAHKRLGFSPYFEEIGHVVGPGLLDEAQRPAVHAAVIEAHAALGLQRVVTHTELRLTAAGPRVIEVNARLGGDLIPHLGYLASGEDLGMAAADIAMGREPSPRPERSRAAGIRFLYPDRDVELIGVESDPAIHELPWIERVSQLAPAGAELRLPPGGFLSRAAAVVALADDAAQCERRLGHALRLLRLTGRDLD
jgi:biotin carboxylase